MSLKKRGPILLQTCTEGPIILCTLEFRVSFAKDNLFRNSIMRCTRYLCSAFIFDRFKDRFKDRFIQISFISKIIVIYK